MRGILLLFIFVVYSFAGNSYRVLDAKDSMDVGYRINTLSKVFDDLSWDNPGLYLFIENKTLRLFFMDFSNEVFIYQYPPTKASKWIEPERYLKERDEVLSNEWKTKCRATVTIDLVDVSKIQDLHLEEIPFVLKNDHYYYADDFNLDQTLFFGMFVDESGKHYFKIKQFEKDESNLAPPLTYLLPAYHRLKKPPFDIILEACK